MAASLFYYEATSKAGMLENILGKNAEAKRHLEKAVLVRQAIRKILWNPNTDGFLAWVEKDGTRHDDWITGNNLHAVACGLADHEQAFGFSGS